MAQWHEFGIHAMENKGQSSNLLNLQVQGMSQDNLQTNASFAEEDIERLKQIHLAKTGLHLSTQEAIEMGIRIKNFLRIVTKPIPEL